jgi:hypothetical protein
VTDAGPQPPVSQAALAGSVQRKYAQPRGTAVGTAATRIEQRHGLTMAAIDVLGGFF